MDYAARYKSIHDELRAVCRAVGRDPRSVRVVAVSKTVDPPAVSAAIAAGFTDLGENRPEALVGRAAQFPQATWHFIGNIQSRKIPDIVSAAALVHSLYQPAHLAAFEKAAAAAGKTQDLLVEVNVSGELSKGGVRPEELAELLEEMASCPHLRVRGLMTMAPQGDRLLARACFKDIARLASALKGRFQVSLGAACMDELSMGMSEDWQEAVAEGATLIRIGRAVFQDEAERSAALTDGKRAMLAQILQQGLMADGTDE